MLTKAELGVGFNKIVPVELPAGQVYVRTLTVRDEISIKAKDLGERMAQRLALQVCDDKGNTFLTTDDVLSMDWDHFDLLSTAINELSETVRKKA